MCQLLSGWELLELSPPPFNPHRTPRKEDRGAISLGHLAEGVPPSPGEWEWSLTGRILVESTDLNKVVLGSDPDSATELNK